MAAYKTALMADSTCDIPQSLVEQYQIAIIPQVVVWGEEVLRDRVDISPDAFYRRLANDPVLPTTSQPSPKVFQTHYQTEIDRGAEEIVLFTVSSAMSGTFQIATQVGKQMSVPVHVVDSKSPTMSMGWQTLTAARAREQGASATAMIAAAAEARERMAQIVLMDSLDHLARTGRIGKATQMLGSLINLKPLIRINHQTGIVEPAGRARTRKKAVNLLIQTFFNELDTEKPLRIAVLHGNALPEAEALAERIKAEYNPKELIINITGPVLGINTGPSALALSGFAEK